MSRPASAGWRAARRQAAPARRTRHRHTGTDGDTVTVITPTQTKLRVRLYGIDALETPKGTTFPRQSLGEEAARSLAQLVGHKPVQVKIYGIDRRRPARATLLRAQTGYSGTMLRCQRYVRP